MESTPVARRHLLQRAGIVAGGALVATTAMAAPAHANDEPDGGGGLTGAWTTDRIDDDGYRAHGIFTFSLGGVVHYQDIFPVNATLHGSWTAWSRRTFRYEMWGGLPADTATGVPGVTIRVAGSGTWGRDAFTNPYIVTAFDGATGTEVIRYGGNATGTRIRP